MLLSLIGLVVAGAFLLGKRGGRLDAMRADAAVRHSMRCAACAVVIPERACIDQIASRHAALRDEGKHSWVMLSQVLCICDCRQGHWSTAIWTKRMRTPQKSARRLHLPEVSVMPQSTELLQPCPASAYWVLEVLRRWQQRMPLSKTQFPVVAQRKHTTRAAWTSWGRWTCPFRAGSSTPTTLCAR